MDTGLVSSRYAKALLRHASNRGVEKEVYLNAAKLLGLLDRPDELGAAIDASTQEMKDLLALMVRNRRTPFLRGILLSIVRLYRKEHGIATASLVSASEDPQLESKIRQLLSEAGFTEIAFSSDVNEQLLGGFVLQIEDRRLDASLSRQLKIIRKELEEKNKRLI